jgi:hypothetical protein
VESKRVSFIMGDGHEACSNKRLGKVGALKGIPALNLDNVAKNASISGFKTAGFENDRCLT